MPVSRVGLGFYPELRYATETIRGCSLETRVPTECVPFPGSTGAGPAEVGLVPDYSIQPHEQEHLRQVPGPWMQ